jgi:hypothetical protein
MSAGLVPRREQIGRAMDREQNTRGNFAAATAFGLLLVNGVLIIEEGLVVWHSLPRNQGLLSLLWGAPHYIGLTRPYFWTHVTVPTYAALAVDLGIAVGAEYLRRRAVLPGRASGFLALRRTAQVCAALNLMFIAGVMLFTPHFSLI